EAHAFWFEKSLDEAQPFFDGGQSIQRAQELLHMPRPAFRFYVFAFAQFVMSEAAIGDPDAASGFLNNLIAREERDPGSVAQLFARLEPTVDFVAGSQSRFDASHDIYGDFAEKAAVLKKLMGTTHSPLDPEDQMLDSTDDA
ncbi:MAG TPA: hypothetical protein VIV63_07080, partial [Steroidobacteraceae bacterium]